MVFYTVRWYFNDSKHSRIKCCIQLIEWNCDFLYVVDFQSFFFASLLYKTLLVLSAHTNLLLPSEKPTRSNQRFGFNRHDFHVSHDGKNRLAFFFSSSVARFLNGMKLIKMNYIASTLIQVHTIFFLCVPLLALHIRNTI